MRYFLARVKMRVTQIKFAFVPVIDSGAEAANLAASAAANLGSVHSLQLSETKAFLSADDADARR
jgi:hypothetical protein